ncbi:MAG: GTPase ObgE [Candidatus Goldbacteria bacterium]|nr:GTPase ObgE [Candidatus Goldiibacteriota bacterium]
MFVDHVQIMIESGKGGNGASTFRREKYVPKGGPDGGDGGRGGHVYFVADRHLNTLVDFHFNKLYKAEKGVNGAGSQMHGRNGKDLYIHVPLGTVIMNAATNEIVADLVKEGDKVLAAGGGRGGRGNIHFKSSTRQAPRFYEKGEPGIELSIALELKLLADVGIIGMANAGKSTLLSKISNARPKIGNYPFTTLVPVLGIVKVDAENAFVAADIPGLIEGASEGKGLGIEFLRHIERTKVYVHVVDPTQGDAFDNYKMINKELAKYSGKVGKRPQVAVINKSDLLSDDEKKEIKDKFKKKKIPVEFISAHKEENLRKVVVKAYDILKKMPVEKEEISTVYYREEADSAPQLEKAGAHVFVLRHRPTERYVEMLDFSEMETVEVFKRYLEKSGMNEFFKANGVTNGDVLVIADRDFIYDDEE